MDQKGPQAFLSDIAGRANDLVAHAPAWAIDMAAVALAVVVALAFHAILIAVVRRAVDARAVFLSSLLAQTRGPTRLALIIIALSIAAAVIPLDPSAAAAAHHALLIAFIILAGWIGVIAVRLAGQIYARRLRDDTGGDLLARKHLTQVRILERTVTVLIVIVAAACVLITFESVREYGVSLFASAGIAGVIAGLAARPVLSNLFAGLQIAIAQPIRLEDAVIVENEWGRIEEITGTYVVVRLWDLRRMIVPLSYFIEKPFQNWTRHSPALIGSVLIYVDYTVPVARMREELTNIVSRSKLWDGQVVNLQVTDARNDTIELRALVSAADAGATSDLRCEVREALIAFLQREYPGALPKRRAEVTLSESLRQGTDGATPLRPGTPAQSESSPAP
ncbi:MAG: mechanosensitive ion channel family protein [Hyphomicrobiales bacterium]|nr:mechanosensitive ion channel family protein [Hyphomicrobiales bacterium]